MGAPMGRGRYLLNQEERIEDLWRAHDGNLRNLGVFPLNSSHFYDVDGVAARG
jgi:hypothetical protein